MFSWLLGSGQAIPYDIGPEVEGYNGRTIWKLFTGKDKKDGAPVSIFACRLTSERSDEEKAAARNALKRFKTIKHPYVLRYIDGLEAEDAKGGNTVYVVTEPVTPLELVLQDGAPPEAATAWGLRAIASALAFLHNGGLMHANVQLATIFCNQAGDWKLGGFELTVDPRAVGAEAWAGPRALLPRKLQPPELQRGQTQILEQAHVGVVDAWLLGIAIFEVFNGRLERPEQLKSTARIPAALTPDYVRLLAGTVPTRLGADALLRNAFFQSDYCALQTFLENLNVQDAAEKERFFARLTDQVPSLPPLAAKYKVLPMLVQNLEYGGGSAKILTPMLRIAKGLSADEFHATVVPIISKLFANTDRAMRLPLLDHLPAIVASIPPRVLNEAIFPQLALGFGDASAQLREATVKSIVPLAPHLDMRALGHVLRAFATLQRDDEAAIRTNTTICLGKITQYLDEPSRQRVLIAAFCRALLDPFAPARRAGALSLAATQAFHSAADSARKVVPAIAPLTIDVDAEVRKSALQCMQVYVAKLETESRRMAAREAGIDEPEPKEGDALAKAASVAQESVQESMTWVSSMLGNLGLGGKAAAGGAGVPQQPQPAQPQMLQPTPTPASAQLAAVRVPTAAAAAAASALPAMAAQHVGVGGSGTPAGKGMQLGCGMAAQRPAGVAGCSPAASVSKAQATMGASAGVASAGAAAAGVGAGDGWDAGAGVGDGWGSGANDGLTDLLGDADFETAFEAAQPPPHPPPAPPPGGASATTLAVAGSSGLGEGCGSGRRGCGVGASSSSGSLGGGKPVKLGAKKESSATWGSDSDFFADLARTPPPKPAGVAPLLKPPTAPAQIAATAVVVPTLAPPALAPSPLPLAQSSHLLGSSAGGAVGGGLRQAGCCMQAPMQAAMQPHAQQGCMGAPTHCMQAAQTAMLFAQTQLQPSQQHLTPCSYGQLQAGAHGCAQNAMMMSMNGAGLAPPAQPFAQLAPAHAVHAQMSAPRIAAPPGVGTGAPPQQAAGLGAAKADGADWDAW
ncbi:hypothetical protein KFE25_006737 [Diacronema lutheri]|uniref:Protein kinase domain-containing protein n=1 Tax=Diacronema lutheri TaxID=2081491 RepID=A0A8J5XTL1_DIALT|nr:hypothetical protein KFE25_006737 [Diacronema lutheri]